MLEKRIESLNNQIAKDQEKRRGVKPLPFQRHQYQSRQNRNSKERKRSNSMSKLSGNSRSMINDSDTRSQKSRRSRRSQSRSKKGGSSNKDILPPPPRVASLNSRSQKTTSEDFELRVGKPSPKMGQKHNNIPFMPVRSARTKKMAKKVKDQEIEDKYD